VIDGENGFTFDHRSPDELAAILRRLTNDEGLLRRLREGACRTRVVTVAEHARAVRTVYEEAVEELSRGGATERADLEELAFLQSALPRLGLATPHAPRPTPEQATSRVVSSGAHHARLPTHPQ
jgi:hypothetical protein